MWNKPSENKILSEAEVKLLLEALGWIIPFWFDSDQKHEMGVNSFDRLHRHEQILAVAHVISKAVNPKIEPTMKEPAWEEATLAAILESVAEEVSIDIEELEEGEEIPNRLTVLIQLGKAMGIEIDIEDFHKNAEEAEEELRESLLDNFLHDRDYQMEETINQAKEPGRYQELLRQLGITPNYYLNVGPEGNQESAQKALEWMKLTWTTAIQSDEEKELIETYGENGFKKRLLNTYHNELKTLEIGRQVWLTAYEIHLLERFNLCKTCYPILCQPKGLKILWGELPSKRTTPPHDETGERLELRETRRWKTLTITVTSTFLVPEETEEVPEEEALIGGDLQINGNEYSPEIELKKVEKITDGDFPYAQVTGINFEEIELLESQHEYKFGKRK